jgi:hypothetical protein
MSGCTDARRALGYVKAPPDEFAVVSRAPLSQPPDFALRPPTPGAPRPQEGTTVDQARTALTQGRTLDNAVAISKGEQALLAKTGADKASPDIRQKIDEETTALVETSGSFADKLIFWQSKPLPGVVLDAPGEAKRLQANASLGQPPTAGETVKIERKGLIDLDDIF